MKASLDLPRACGHGMNDRDAKVLLKRLYDFEHTPFAALQIDSLRFAAMFQKCPFYKAINAVR